MLDTNIVDNLPVPHGPIFMLLEQIATLHHHSLSVPEMVLTEHLAHHRHKVDTQLTAIRTAARTLDRLDARPRVALSLPTAEQSVESRRNVFEGSFLVLPTPTGAEREGMAREANRRRPADTNWDGGKKGGGGRDVVVWLTVLAAVERAARDEQVLFVTADGDFTDRRGNLHPELSAELDERGLDAGRLRVCRSVAELLAVFGEQTQPPADLERFLLAVPQHKSLTEPLASEVAAELIDRFRGPLGISAVAPTGPAQLTLQACGQAEAFRVGETTWVSAACTWNGSIDIAIVASGGQLHVPAPVSPVSFTVKATTLFQLASDGQDAQVQLTSRGPVHLDPVAFAAL